MWVTACKRENPHLGMFDTRHMFSNPVNEIIKTLVYTSGVKNKVGCKCESRGSISLLLPLSLKTPPLSGVNRESPSAHFR
jgi:hypothetical protein